MEDVALKQTAVTRWAALHVPVYQDTPEMDIPVQVSSFILSFISLKKAVDRPHWPKKQYGLLICVVTNLLIHVLV